MRTIYREQAIAIIDELNAVSFYEANEHSREAYKEIRAAIEQLPSAEKIGKWKRIDYADEVNGYLIPNYECSQCGYWSIEDYDYCPNCGSKMEVK